MINKLYNWIFESLKISQYIKIYTWLLWTVLSYGQPTVATEIQPLRQYPPFILPTLSLPIKDTLRHNDLQLLARYPLDGDTYEVSFVFADEDHPWFDKLYDRYRIHRYNRIQDIETIIVHIDTMNTIYSVYLPNTYNTNKKRNAISWLHHTANLSESCDTLYINTRNHMFSSHNNNQDREQYTINLKSIPSIQMNRQTLELFFKH